MVNQLNLAHHQQRKGADRILDSSRRVEQISREQENNLEDVSKAFEEIARTMPGSD